MTQPVNNSTCWLAADVEGAEGNSNGLGIEFYVETSADEIAAEVGDMIGSWQFQMLYQISQLAASEAQHSGLYMMRRLAVLAYARIESLPAGRLLRLRPRLCPDGVIKLSITHGSLSQAMAGSGRI